MLYYHQQSCLNQYYSTQKSPCLSRNRLMKIYPKCHNFKISIELNKLFVRFYFQQSNLSSSNLMLKVWGTCLKIQSYLWAMSFTPYKQKHFPRLKLMPKKMSWFWYAKYIVLHAGLPNVYENEFNRIIT